MEDTRLGASLQTIEPYQATLGGAVTLMAAVADHDAQTRTVTKITRTSTVYVAASPDQP